MEMAMVSATDQLQEIILDFKEQLGKCDSEGSNDGDNDQEIRMRREMASKIADTLTLIEQDFTIMAKGVLLKNASSLNRLRQIFVCQK